MRKYNINNVNYKNDDTSNSNERKCSYYFKGTLLVVCTLYIFSMDIQRVPNSLFLVWTSKGYLIVSIQLVLNPILLGLRTITIQYNDKQSALNLQRLYELILGSNVSLRISGDKPRWILNTSVAKTCNFVMYWKRVVFI